MKKIQKLGLFLTFINFSQVIPSDCPSTNNCIYDCVDMNTGVAYKVCQGDKTLQDCTDAQCKETCRQALGENAKCKTVES